MTSPLTHRLARLEAALRRQPHIAQDIGQSWFNVFHTLSTSNLTTGLTTARKVELWRGILQSGIATEAQRLIYVTMELEKGDEDDGLLADAVKYGIGCLSCCFLIGRHLLAEVEAQLCHP